MTSPLSRTPLVVALLLFAATPAAARGEVVGLEVGRLLSGVGAAGDELGRSLALDGDWLAVGAPRAANGGAVDLFERRASGWTWTQRLPAPEGGPGSFGAAVDLDGRRLVVGDPQDGELGLYAGAVHVFELVGGVWRWVVKFAPNGTGPDHRVGSSVALDGDTLLVGAPMNGFYSVGAAFVFVHSGVSWTQVAWLSPAIPVDAARFGISVALEGDTAVVGAIFAKGYSPGAAHVFTRQGSTWTLSAVLQAPGGEQFTGFGSAVDLDGDLLVVGAPEDTIAGIWGGAGYVYARAPSTEVWSLQAYLSVQEPANGRRLGVDVSVRGSRILLGAPQNAPGNLALGEAYVFVLDGAQWVQSARLTAADTVSLSFGLAVALGEDEALVGAPYDSDLGGGSGSAVVFELQRAAVSYCTGKINSSGCVPALTTTASASASSQNPFAITMRDALPGESGVLLYGFGKAGLPFHGGTLCVKPPVARWLPATQAQAGGAPPCDGVLTRDFNERVQSGADVLLTAGQRVSAQWLQRDPSDPAGFQDSLSNAVRFVVGP